MRTNKVQYYYHYILDCKFQLGKLDATNSKTLAGKTAQYRKGKLVTVWKENKNKNK